MYLNERNQIILMCLGAAVSSLAVSVYYPELPIILHAGIGIVWGMVVTALAK